MIIAVTPTLIATYDHSNHQFVPLTISDTAMRDELHDAINLIRQGLIDDLGILLCKMPSNAPESPQITIDDPVKGETRTNICNAI